MTGEVSGPAGTQVPLEELRAVAADVLRTAPLDAVQLSASAVWGSRPVRLGSTSAAADRCERAQDGAAGGPRLLALAGEVPVVVPDLGRERRWPSWSEQARGEGFGSAVAVPGRTPGALVVVTLLRPAAGAWPAADLGAAARVARLLARTTGLALRCAASAGPRVFAPAGDARPGGSGGAGSPGLDRAEPDRAELDRAVGVVMAQRRCTSEEALRVLTDAAAAQGATLPAVCAHVTALVAGGARPRSSLLGGRVWP